MSSGCMKVAYDRDRSSASVQPRTRVQAGLTPDIMPS